jgi:wobble nucleotide-excising tRNase
LVLAGGTILKKIIAIKNVGRFRNSAAPGNPQLAKYTFVHGANGYGKSTLCAVLRSLQTGDAAFVLGRKTLGVVDNPLIELLLEGSLARFDGTAWSTTLPAMAIFDASFVTENVHSGDVVDIEHKRSLYRIIVGDVGAKLAAEEAELAAASRTKTSELSAMSKAIQPYAPGGMSLPNFIDLPRIVDIDERIAAQERATQALRQSDALRARVGLSAFIVPAFPNEFAELLSRTIEDIAQDAEQIVSAHLTAHDMVANGGNWVAEGLGHAAETCPFCGQGIQGLSLIAAFRSVFSDRYKALADQISDMKVRLVQSMGDAALAHLGTVAAQNGSAAEFWRNFSAIDPRDVALPTQALEDIRSFAAAGLDLLEHKASRPLDVVGENESFISARHACHAAIAAIEAVNSRIVEANQVIAEKKIVAESGDLKAAESELSRLKAIQIRHRDDVAQVCNSHAVLWREKSEIDARKGVVRTQLDEHTRTVVKPYERRINYYLEAFNAGFSIAETKHAYPGGVATSSYQIVIHDIAFAIGDSETPAEQPSFKNTLSAGDRTTLAFAFFLAHLERDSAIAGKLVIFDDPFSSQDAFRRRQTVHEIMKVAERSCQIIVLSHDATFLKLVWDKSPAAERIALAIADHRAQGSKILPMDIEQACRGRTATDVDDLQTYSTTGAGRLLDIIRKMRVVLETHCRSTYSGCFVDGDWLGDMVRKIREGGEAHPAEALYDELEQINSYTSQYHHGENVADPTPDQIDPTELTGFTRRTLRIVNALQA